MGRSFDVPLSTCASSVHCCIQSRLRPMHMFFVSCLSFEPISEVQDFNFCGRGFLGIAYARWRCCALANGVALGLACTGTHRWTIAFRKTVFEAMRREKSQGETADRNVDNIFDERVVMRHRV